MKARFPSGASSATVLAGLTLRPWSFGRAALRRWLRGLGWPGALATGLFVACGAFYFSAYLPAQERLDEARALVLEHQRARNAGQLRAAPPTPAEQLAQFHRGFPPEGELITGVERIFAAAASRGLTLDQGEYKVSRGSAGRLTRFQLTLPLKGEYPRLREFLAAVLADLPHVALEQVQFERARIGDPVIEGRIKLALYLEGGS